MWCPGRGTQEVGEDEITTVDVIVKVQDNIFE